ncbi:MAG TPA: transposase, partial [Desulfatirhabdiaceae bacterium]|nr:transposase [Desulfatirhabdiaceae bacterium]
RQEAFEKKTDILVQMLQYAWNSGIDAACVLFDSWFSYDSVIHKVVETGYDVVCRLKNGNVQYQYQGKKYTLKQLWSQFAKKQLRWIDGYPVKGCCLIVSLPETGEVKLLFTSDGHRNWHGFLATDLSLSASQIVDYYSRRWAIEVFFKDAKQMLYLGKEQSKTFDAAVSGYSMVMIRYLLLIYLINNGRLIGPLGPLFREISDTELMLAVADKLWEQIKQSLLKSIDLFLDKIEYKSVSKIIDIIEYTMFGIKPPLTAKV